MIYGQPITFGGASGEIPITDNGVYDVKKYATANVNVQSNPELVWTNASPTSSFAAQTVSVDGAGGTGYLVEIVRQATESTPVYGYCFVKIGGMSGACIGEGSVGVSRGIYQATNTGIQFLNGYMGATRKNEMAVPTRIWRVKFSL